MDNHTWRKCRKPILVAVIFTYKNRGNPKQPFKPRTSTLAVHQPPPAQQEQPAKVNLLRQERPSQIWKLSDTENVIVGVRVANYLSIFFPHSISPYLSRLVDKLGQMSPCP